MGRITIKFLIFAAALAGLVFIHIKYLEARSVFFPAKVIELTPGDVSLSYKNIYFKTNDDVTIHGWFIPREGAAHTLLFCHGNAGNISCRLEKILSLREAGLNILIFDYRGYGRSGGKPSEKGVYLDARAAYEYLVGERGVSPEHIVLYGESLGSAVAVNLACAVKIEALITEGAFTSGKDMGKVLYPYIPKIILPDLFNSLKRIKDVSAPKLFIHSRNDEVVPFYLGWELYNKAEEPKYIIAIAGSHGAAFIDSKEKYNSAISNFVQALN